MNDAGERRQDGGDPGRLGIRQSMNGSRQVETNQNREECGKRLQQGQEFRFHVSKLLFILNLIDFLKWSPQNAA
ncbi:MAG: hypothetical protein EOP06_09160 [Proteobacteria bacterium]|nr:MAG: hypothetical protein EOP06_09160 [Pseudomonadota bacterium]